MVQYYTIYFIFYSLHKSLTLTFTILRGLNYKIANVKADVLIVYKLDLVDLSHNHLLDMYAPAPICLQNVM